MDENTERRNHYLDLAGIENYTSRFEGQCVFFSCWILFKTSYLKKSPFVLLVPQEALPPSHLRRLKVAAIRARLARAPRSQRPRLSTTGARRSSVTPTSLQSCEARPSSSNHPREPTREEATEPAEAANPLNATATTHLCKPELDTEGRTSTTYRTKASLPATISTLCSTATANE